jgi:hypothetical protein
MQQTNSFHVDLERGQVVEMKVVDILRKKYPSTSLVHAYKGYDIWIPELNKSVEVKYDPMSNKTNNIVVEIEMYGKPSALLATKADFWVFYDDVRFVSIKPMRIVECILVNQLQYKEFIGKGDNVSKKAFLIPKPLLFTYGNDL